MRSRAATATVAYAAGPTVEADRTGPSPGRRGRTTAGASGWPPDSGSRPPVMTTPPLLTSAGPPKPRAARWTPRSQSRSRPRPPRCGPARATTAPATPARPATDNRSSPRQARRDRHPGDGHRQRTVKPITAPPAPMRCDSGSTAPAAAGGPVRDHKPLVASAGPPRLRTGRWTRRWSSSPSGRHGAVPPGWGAPAAGLPAGRDNGRGVRRRVVEPGGAVLFSRGVRRGAGRGRRGPGRRRGRRSPR